MSIIFSQHPWCSAGLMMAQTLCPSTPTASERTLCAWLMMHLCLQSWNHFSDSEAERVKMMEEVEKLCDRLELARYV